MKGQNKELKPDEHPENTDLMLSLWSNLRILE